MSDSSPVENDFLNELSAIVEKNISDEKFGVSELADEMNMSRSNLLRKVKNLTRLSVSQLINQIRLKRAMEMLRKSSMNVSEVSHQVGFNSTSYFIKCFREYYGYPPGEVGKRDELEIIPVPLTPSRFKVKVPVVATGGLLIALVGFLLYNIWPSSSPSNLEKSIAVLPFKNDSNDSTNVYLINGLMESTLNNLQKIEDLKVISRTSAEKYRNAAKSIPEMGRELNANYFVEGSGQKIGDQILLNIQLIEASTDNHLWSKQYKREAKDIFALQQEVARNIADEIQAIITPEEKTRIEKIPTEDLIAYDNFLKGRELLNKGGTANLEKAVNFFKKAIEQDDKFAQAYAYSAITYYYLDIYKAEKKYTAEITSYADKALLYDSKLAESLVAKAFSYMSKKENDQAIPYLEKALEYNPNSHFVISMLADFYSNYFPNTAKYLEYALQGVRLDIGSNDSVTTSYIYLRLGNALIQTGFVDESLKYIDKSLEYNPKNPFSNYIRAFILYAKTKDLRQTHNLLIKEFKKDTTRFDILQDIGKTSYYLREYDSAYFYYKRFIAIRDARKLDVYRHENLVISYVLSKVGQKEKSDEYVKNFKIYAEGDRSIYKHLSIGYYYAYTGDSKKAIEHMRLFSKEEDYHYWVILFLRSDPITDNIKDPEIKQIIDGMENRFWKRHKKISETLAEKGLLLPPSKAIVFFKFFDTITFDMDQLWYGNPRSGDLSV